MPLPKNRPTMVAIAGFFKKSSTSTFYLQFVHISSFFQIFPKPDADREAWYICSHSACKCSAARGRPRKAVFPTGPRICEFFATSSGLLYGLIFSRKCPAGRETGKPQPYKLATIFHMIYPSWKIVQERDITNFVASSRIATPICFQERDKNRDQRIFEMRTGRENRYFFLL